MSGVLQSKLSGNPAQEPNAVFYTGMSTMSLVCYAFFNIPVIYFFSVRERAIFYKSCNLIGSESGQYSPHPGEFTC